MYGRKRRTYIASSTQSRKKPAISSIEITYLFEPTRATQTCQQQTFQPTPVNLLQTLHFE
ncbi:MAG: hypothetical protein ACI8XU_002899, partial [Kiritimatiellia bacterium]